MKGVSGFYVILAEDRASMILPELTHPRTRSSKTLWRLRPIEGDELSRHEHRAVSGKKSLPATPFALAPPRQNGLASRTLAGVGGTMRASLCSDARRP